MKISKLIKELQKVQDKHGDLIVKTPVHSKRNSIAEAATVETYYVDAACTTADCVLITYAKPL